MPRYQRQVVLPEVGPDGQARLARARVLCVGAGGLGAPALLYLAAAGVGHIGIIDHDIVEETNLQRQVLYTEADISAPKAIAARHRLLALNSQVDITAYEEKLHPGNIEAFFSGYDIILDGTDNFSAKYLINDAAVKLQKPWVYGAVQGFDGQVAVFDARQGPCYRCLYPDASRAPVSNCAEAGVIGAAAGMVGAMQALQVIQIILDNKHYTPLRGKLWVTDLYAASTYCLTIQKNKNCLVCSRPLAQITLSCTPDVCVTDVIEVSPIHLAHQDTVLLVDVREEPERLAGHISNDTHFPLSWLEDGRPFTAKKETAVILYCQQGLRSRRAAALLKQQGYINVSSLSGGYQGWHALRLSERIST